MRYRHLSGPEAAPRLKRWKRVIDVYQILGDFGGDLEFWCALPLTIFSRFRSSRTRLSLVLPD